MNTFSKVGLGFGLPALFFFVLQDSIDDFFDRPEPLNLVGERAAAPAPAEEVAETEEAEPAVEEEAAADEEVTEAAVEEAEPGPADAVEASFDVAAAERVMRACKTCHVWDKEQNRTGPHLVGVIGRAIGGVEGYNYSDALSALNAEGQVWDQAAMVAWLEDPSDFAPGTKMNYKVRSAEDRALIAEYLDYLSQ